MSSGDSYASHVRSIEGAFAPYAKRSFEDFSQAFVDGGEIHRHFEDLWHKPGGPPKLSNRTPLQLERDRILYADVLRKQTEKYHVLYSGERRIVRNYTTHTMRMAQVSRAIAASLRLNSDFVEAIALGSKVGAAPFIHASKRALADWLREQLLRIDNRRTANGEQTGGTPQLSLEVGDVPAWVRDLRCQSVIDAVERNIPWAAGVDVDEPYTAGAQSYWMLAAEPFIVEALPARHAPETMYGVWRHSRQMRPGRGSFHHRMQLPNATSDYNEIRSVHATYEGVVAQYADDITWAIENLNDADTAARLGRKESVYEQLRRHITDQAMPEEFYRAVTSHDAGGLYSCFISDFITASAATLERLDDGAINRQALRNGESESLIGLSEDGEAMLEGLIGFLDQFVFEEARVKNRREMLATITTACVTLMYEQPETVMSRYIENRAHVERWRDDWARRAHELLEDEVHRAQLAVDIFARMSDQEIYDFVGIQSL